MERREAYLIEEPIELSCYTCRPNDASILRTEDQLQIVPLRTSFQSCFVLAGSMRFQNVADRNWQEHNTITAFRLRLLADGPLMIFCLRQCALDVKRASLEIDILPAERKAFSSSHPKT